jgi:phage tail-like protein
MEFAFLGSETAAEWARWDLMNLQVVDGELDILGRFTANPMLDVDDVVDLASDRCENLYLLRSDGALSRLDPRRQVVEPVRVVAPEDGTPERPVALAVTTDGFFLAGEGDEDEPGRVHALSRYPLEERWVSEADFPGALALHATDTDVYLLDRGSGSDAGKLFGLRVGGASEVVVDGLDAPVDAAVDRDGRCYVLDERDGELVVGRFEAGAGPATFPDDAAERGTLPPGATCIEADRDGVVVAVGSGEAAARTPLYRYRFAGSSFERLVDFEGTCSALVSRPGGFYALVQRTTDGGTVLYSLGEDGENRLRPPFRDRPAEFAGRATRRFDSGERGTDWHRFTLDRRLDGPGTQVRVVYHATDEDLPTPRFEVLGDGTDETPGALAGAHASRLYEAGVEGLAELAELEADEVEATVGVDEAVATAWIERAREVLDEQWRRWEAATGGDPVLDPADALFESATGRYLWVGLELVGTVDTSPRVGSFRAYFPRQSLLRYLPALYRDDPASAAFLERFLSVFESTFVEVEEKVEGLTRYFDPYGVEAEYLSWLGGWLAVDVDETWPESATRAFLARAPELFRGRGTRAGLLEMIGLYLESVGAADTGTAADAADVPSDAAGEGPDEGGELGPGTGTLGPLPYLWEYADLDCIDGSTGARADYERLVGHPRAFVLLLDPSVTDEQVRATERIVEAATPAHAVGRVVRLRPWIQLGRHSYLGLNSRLPTREFVLDRSTLGEDSTLTGGGPPRSRS